MFNLNDPTVRDRVAMLRIGERMVAAHPLTGVGPNMVAAAVRAVSRARTRSKPVNPHLHNVPLQIAAERGLPALALWLWFIVAVVRDLWQRFSSGRQRELAAAALAAIGALLAAGLFEYNFGDSEFLMLFLIIVTLPARGRPVRRAHDAAPARREPRPRSRRAIRRPARARRRRRHARSLHRRPGHAHLARSAGPVVRFQSEHVRLGGAANVAHNIAALGGQPSLVGVVGADAAAARLREQLALAGVDVDGLVEDRSRPTTEKVRIVTERNQQVARHRLRARRRRRGGGRSSARRPRRSGSARDADVLLVSDYLKGAVTRPVMEALLRSRRRRRSPRREAPPDGSGAGASR